MPHQPLYPLPCRCPLAWAATGSTSCAPSSAACLWGMVTLNPIQSASASGEEQNEVA